MNTQETWREEFVKDFCILVPYRDTQLTYWRGSLENNINLIPTPKTVMEWIEEEIQKAITRTRLEVREEITELNKRAQMTGKDEGFLMGAYKFCEGALKLPSLSINNEKK